MEKLSDIAKDYLADFEVLTEARKEFEQQLEQWWTEIFTKRVEPALLKHYEKKPDIWVNKTQPGMCHWRAHNKHSVYLEIIDPRASERRFYTVSIMVGSQPHLKAMVKQDALVSKLNAVARQQKLDGDLNWNQRQLATSDIELLPDDPEETARRVCDTAVRFYQVVLEYAKMTDVGK